MRIIFSSRANSDTSIDNNLFSIIKFPRSCLIIENYFAPAAGAVMSQIINDVRSIFQYCLSSKNKLTNQVETQNSGHEKVNECR